MNNEEEIYIPIPHYPPFQLRSSLIDQDPVIWAHLLEAYIQLFQYLLDEHSQKLTVKSQQQLALFLKVYLQETAEESTKIFSLGQINPEIKANTAALRAYVFSYIKNSSIAKVSLTGESVWNFITVYVEKNATLVRSLVDGSFKLKLNDNKKSGSISSAPFVQKHLEQKIINGKLLHADLTTLSLLLGQQTQNRTTKISINGVGSKARQITKNKNGSIGAFAEVFVSVAWVEMLEKLYSGGSSIHAEVVKNIMVISAISLPVSKISKLITQLGINTALSLNLYPLLSSIIVSEPYKELIPNLEERLPFLRNITYDTEAEDDIPISEESITLLLEFFPLLIRTKAVNILKDNNGDVEHVTNLLLENPDIIDSISDEAPKPKKAAPRKPAPVVKRSVYDNDKIAQLDFSDTSVVFGKKAHSREILSGEEKKKTLESALRLLHDDDDDEPDDTYDDQETTIGSAMVVGRGRGRAAMENSPVPERVFDGKVTEVSPSERHLYFLFKTEGAEPFGVGARKSHERDQLKHKVGWADERIELWHRVVSQSKRRLKSLEEDFLKSRPMKLTRAQTRALDAKPEKKGAEKKETEKKDKPLSKELAKIAAARKEKSKGSRANHNRKQGHDKKSRSEMAGMQ